MRAILVVLADGPQTISRLAERRAVSRQFVQRLVKALLAGGWVRTRANPQHKGSPLIVLSDKGEAELIRIRQLEAPLLAQLGLIASPQDLAGAAAVLERLCERLDGPDLSLSPAAPAERLAASPRREP
jgi:DNA-binding MarR family transcriptional regulator